MCIRDRVVTIPDLNTLFADNGLPKVREITRLVGIEKDGEREPLDPWNHNMIVFKPAGKIGFIQPSITNVTGVLHMGHMLNNTIQDILVRRADVYKRQGWYDR